MALKRPENHILTPELANKVHIGLAELKDSITIGKVSLAAQKRNRFIPQGLDDWAKVARENLTSREIGQVLRCLNSVARKLQVVEDERTKRTGNWYEICMGDIATAIETEDCAISSLGQTTLGFLQAVFPHPDE